MKVELFYLMDQTLLEMCNHGPQLGWLRKHNLGLSKLHQT